MHVLLLGSGAREHALGWALTRDGAQVSSAPGNPGLAELGPLIPGVPITEPSAVVEAAESFDMVVVGPEAPLAAGVADALEEAHIPVVGPGRVAARLEWSKAFAKEVMAAAGVPTARATAHATVESAMTDLDERHGPFVVKADGLAAGKGVLVTDVRSEAADWVTRCVSGDFGPAGSVVVIEDFLEGPELSVFALVDGETAVAFGHARDHKRLLNGDRGPNTGGMGCFSPVPSITGELVERIMDDTVTPVISELAGRGIPYRGFLYVGLVLTETGPQVLEYNCRMGDPEAEVVLPLIKSGIPELLMGAAAGGLRVPPVFTGQAAVDVVLASAGYPTRSHTGATITGIDEAEAAGALVFQGGTARSDDGSLVTAGGRVVNVVGIRDDLGAARAAAYRGAELIEYTGKQLRTDIGAEGDVG